MLPIFLLLPPEPPLHPDYVQHFLTSPPIFLLLLPPSQPPLHPDSVQRFPTSQPLIHLFLTLPLPTEDLLFLHQIFLLCARHLAVRFPTLLHWNLTLPPVKGRFALTAILASLC